jgi:excisionase family DNA binding protein
MNVGIIRERLLQCVSDTLQAGAVDDIFLVADQLRVLGSALAGLPNGEEIDLHQQTLDTARAARLLGYHAEHVRRLIRHGTLPATKAGADYRIPLTEVFAVLVRRHQAGTAELLPGPRPAPVANRTADERDLEIAIDVIVKRGSERQTVCLQRFNVELGALLHQEAGFDSDGADGKA